jgi:hypothetical protein
MAATPDGAAEVLARAARSATRAELEVDLEFGN